MTNSAANDPAVSLLREVAATGVHGNDSLLLAIELTSRPVAELLAELIADQLARRVESQGPA